MFQCLSYNRFEGVFPDYNCNCFSNLILLKVDINYYISNTFQFLYIVAHNRKNISFCSEPTG